MCVDRRYILKKTKPKEDHRSPEQLSDIVLKLLLKSQKLSYTYQPVYLDMHQLTNLIINVSKITKLEN